MGNNGVNYYGKKNNTEQSSQKDKKSADKENSIALEK